MSVQEVFANVNKGWDYFRAFFPHGLEGMRPSARLLLGFSLFVFVAPSLAGQPETPRDQQEFRAFRSFFDRVEAYVKLQHELDSSLPTLKPTSDATLIVEHQHALAGLIADARRTSRQGDIFTREVTERFRKIIRREFSGPEGQLARKTIHQEDSSINIVRLHVNEVFPEGVPLTTTPPALLIKLPALPRELAYRFVGRDLTLMDIKARLIVDLIPNAIP